jgi:hypothetical protein
MATHEVSINVRSKAEPGWVYVGAIWFIGGIGEAAFFVLKREGQVLSAVCLLLGAMILTIRVLQQYFRNRQ